MSKGGNELLDTPPWRGAWKPFNLVTRENIETPLANPNVRIDTLVHRRISVGPGTGGTACGLSFGTRDGWAPRRGHRTRALVDCMACVAIGVPP